MPLLGIYSWSQFTLPGGIPTADLTDDTHANHPDHVDYVASAATWIGQTFTYNGGAPSQIIINDDDAVFEDGYVETGTPQTLDQAVTIDGTTYPAGSVVENEFSLIDAGGLEVFIVRINGVNVGFAYPAGQHPTTGDSFTGAQSRDGAPEDSSDLTSASTEPYAGVICFAAETLIATPLGLREVASFRAGEIVTTRDHGPQPIRWVGTTPIRFSGRDDPRKPILLRAGCLGNGLPLRDLVVSPQHRMLMRGPHVRALFDRDQVLAPAKGLVGLPGIRVMRGKSAITYVHVLLDRHEILLAEGAQSESFLPGPAAMLALQDNQRREIFARFAQLRHSPDTGYGQPARYVTTVREAERLVADIKRGPVDNPLLSDPEQNLPVAPMAWPSAALPLVLH